MHAQPKANHFINGTYVEDATGVPFNCVHPATREAIAEILVEAGAPAGLFDVVQGQGEVGASLATHLNVAKVSLTGSLPTGRRVYAAAAEGLRHVTMELGRKSPLIIFDDADIDNAVGGAMLGNFNSTGQACSNGTCVFVQNSIRNQFLEALVKRAHAIRIGDPMDEDVQMGPMASATQHQRVSTYIEAGISEGAKCLTGGGIPRHQWIDDGFFMEPTVFAGVTDEMMIAKEEIFEPVMSVLGFEDEDEVVARANDTEFGLFAGEFTNDPTRAHRVVDWLEAGTLWINHYNLASVAVPFSEYKMSGVGRENSGAALDYYTELKPMNVGIDPVDSPN